MTVCEIGHQIKKWNITMYRYYSF